MANRDIVAIGTSAGGFEALRFLAKGFGQGNPDNDSFVACNFARISISC
jgi:chemotaxis response regulator CheB